MNSFCIFFLRTLKTFFKFSFLNYIFYNINYIFIELIKHNPNEAYKKKAISSPNKYNIFNLAHLRFLYPKAFQKNKYSDLSNCNIFKQIEDCKRDLPDLNFVLSILNKFFRLNCQVILINK
jgi:hypothetical protein